MQRHSLTLLEVLLSCHLLAKAAVSAAAVGSSSFLKKKKIWEKILKGLELGWGQNYTHTSCYLGMC